MNIHRLAALIAVSLALVSSVARASENEGLKVEASRALSLGVVDLDLKNPASEQLHEAFKESLSFVMSQRCKMPTPIKPVKLDASRAGWGLGTGTYDVAVVLGGVVPKTMVSASFTILK